MFYYIFSNFRFVCSLKLLLRFKLHDPNKDINVLRMWKQKTCESKNHENLFWEWKEKFSLSKWFELISGTDTLFHFYFYEKGYSEFNKEKLWFGNILKSIYSVCCDIIAIIYNQKFKSLLILLLKDMYIDKNKLYD